MLIDEASYIEHFGTKGMKWGVRRDRRVNNYRLVSKGGGNVGNKVRAYGDLGPIDLVKGRGFRGGSARKAERIANSTKNIRAGKAGARDILTRIANLRYQDMFPTGKAATDTSAGTRASIAGTILATSGRLILGV